ncbi:MAG: alpha/beta fold hydrolase [Oscillochloris sp.]|nr:alpha/beta fold hydrolase [Oscillochloris sp.]
MPQLGRRWTYLLAPTALLLLIVLAIGVHAYARFTTMIAPLHNSACCTLPADDGPAITPVVVTTPDQLRLACWYVPAENRAAIILLHGEGGDRQMLLAHLRLLAQRGYGVLSCDRRAHGASDGEQRSWGWLEVGDVGAMLAFVQRQPEVDPARIGVLGFSMGAQIALRAAAQYPTIRAIVADGPVPATVGDLFPPSGPSEWPRAGIDWLDNWFVDRLLEHALRMPAPAPVVTAVAQRAQPLLLMSTGQSGHGRELRQVAWFFAQARAPKDRWELPAVGHGEGLARYPADYAQQVLGFFEPILLTPTPTPP